MFFCHKLPILHGMCAHVFETVFELYKHSLLLAHTHTTLTCFSYNAVLTAQVNQLSQAACEFPVGDCINLL